MPKVEKGKLTPKQAKFVKGVAEGLPYQQAAMNAYDVAKMSTAAVIANENLNKPNVKEAIDKALAFHGLNAEMATLPVVRALAYQGDTERDTLDMQLKGTDRYLRLLAMTEDKQNNSGNNTIIFNDNRKTSKYVDPS